jgi:heat shock protein HtpX
MDITFSWNRTRTYFVGIWLGLVLILSPLIAVYGLYALIAIAAIALVPPLGILSGKITGLTDMVLWLCESIPTIIRIASLLFILYIIKVITWQIVGIPVVNLIEHTMTVPYVASAIVLGLVGLTGGGILFTLWKTGPEVDWSLTLRIVSSILILTVATVLFFVFVWSILRFTALVGMSFVRAEHDIESFVATVITAGLLFGFVIYELNHIDTVEQHPAVTPVTPAEFPTVYSITTTVAAQLDVPMPTIAVAERAEPEAITVGYRPGNITLILSQGTLASLDDRELEAVVAHELSHVANMDAIVMTVASLPVILADGLFEQVLGMIGTSEPDKTDTNRSVIDASVEDFLSNARKRSPHNLILIMFLMISILTKIASWPAIAVLARARELTADRTAATVTGSPAALASALRTLDERIAETPSKDLRDTSSLSSLSILPLDPIDSHQESGEGISVDGILSHVNRFLFATHPPTERRIDALTDLIEED